MQTKDIDAIVSMANPTSQYFSHAETWMKG